MPAQINTLLTEPDGSELVRDQIAAILRLELDNQRALATAQSLDPTPWDVRVFVERAGAFEEGIARPSKARPLVNVWIDNQTWDESASNIMERQKTRAFINVDVTGYGVARLGESGGQEPADHRAALECQRVVRLCRQMLMAAPYTYLGMRGVVWRRWPQSLSYYQPTIDQRRVLEALGGRLTFAVDFNEFSPQTAPETLEFLAVQLQRAETGEVYFDAAYDYTGD